MSSTSSGSVGRSVRRKEDERLLTGRGVFVADMAPSGLLHAAFVRSPHAHALVCRLETAAAEQLPGVRAVITGADLDRLTALARMPLLVPSPAIRHPITWEPLVREEVGFAGQAVAMVVADSRYIAEDAVDLIDVEYEPLDAVVRLPSLQETVPAPPAHREVTDNLVARFPVGFGDVDAAFEQADHVVAEQYVVHRGAAQPLEGRAVMASPDADGVGMTVWSATQAPYIVKQSLAATIGIPEDRLRVVAPEDVGGGFGPKGIVYPEEVMVAVAARLTEAPVSWIEDRLEHVRTTTQERDQVWNVQMALDRDGKILGLRGAMEHDAGAYLPWGLIQPHISSSTFPGPYQVPAYGLDVSVWFTNTTPTSPVRGAGRPQAVFVMERLLDRAADQLGIDRAQLRRQNLICPDQMPYSVGLTFRDGTPVRYDTGDYPATLDAALELADWDGFEQRRAEAAKRGVRRGIGVACCVEGTGLGPFEGATVQIERSGQVTVATGASPQGQSHHTILAQICADHLGVAPEDVTVVTGDTSAFPHGVGTFASRIAVNAGSSVHDASKQLATQVRQLVSQQLEVNEDDLELADGRIHVRGVPSQGFAFDELAALAGGVPGFALAGLPKPGLASTAYHMPEQPTYAHSTQVVEVEVDTETGEVDLVRYIVSHDCGTVLNPALVQGQIQGGVAHGIGNALLERIVHDEVGVPASVTLRDYLLPVAASVPKVEIIHQESPTPLNPLGAKGAGEGGTIPAAAAIIGAIEMALVDTGVGHLASHPMTVADLLEALEGGKQMLSS